MTGAFDKRLALVCAYASAAAYELEDAARQAYLLQHGLVEHGYIQSRLDARVLVCEHPTLGIIRAHQGTQFTRLELDSIEANLKAEPVDLGDGRHVHEGYLEQLRSVAAELARLPRPQWITGHSQGGAIANIDANELTWGAVGLVTFGAPRSGDMAFWQAARNRPLRVVHAQDFAPGFPEISTFVQPAPMWWLHDGTVERVDHRPGINISIADHDIDAGYIRALEALP